MAAVTGVAQASAAQSSTLPDVRLVQRAIDLRDQSGNFDGQMAIASSAYHLGDGGGGLFRWSGQATRTDDGGVVLGAVGQHGRWLRQVDTSTISLAWFGAVANGAEDSSEAFERAWASSRSQGYPLFIPPGRYHISRPFEVDGGGDYTPSRVEAFGAVVDNTVILSGYRTSIVGLTVDGAAEHGFVFLRGQGASHQMLTARHCGGSGFFCGSTRDNDEAPFGKNMQVTRSHFDSCVAKSNAEAGWTIDGRAKANRSWFNANHVNNLASIDNGGAGLEIRGGSGPAGESQANYNVFTNLTCERNGGLSLKCETGRLNSFVGGHFADKHDDGTSSQMKRGANFFFGGRHAGDVSVSDLVGFTNSGGTKTRGIISSVHDS